MSQGHAKRHTVAIVDDYEVVVRGLYAMIRPAKGLEVVELASMTEPTRPVDIVLYDSFAAEQGVGADLLRLVANPNVGKVVVYTWTLDADHLALARDAGVSGYLSKELGADALVSALQQVADGERVFSAPQKRGDILDAGEWDWPGRAAGLTAREAEILGLIVQGLTNQQVAHRAYLSVNSVKTHIRSIYRKIEVTRRAQAILWGIANGFRPVPKVTHLG